MQTNSYRLIKWALMAGVTASFATACVVSEGDGNGDGTNLGEGGGSNTGTGGKAGSTSTAGKAASGSSSKAGDTSTAGAATGEGGAGGGGAGFVAGTCDGMLVGDEVQPTLLPNCDPVDTDDACVACLKAKPATCDKYKPCFGEEPPSACAVGAAEGDRGQFACVVKCYADNEDMLTSTSDLLADCSAGCINQCTIDTINLDTSELIAAANDPATCEAECFPFN